MPHEIINQYGKHIFDEDIRSEINHAIEHALTHTYFDGSRIEIVKDSKSEELHTTLVNVYVWKQE